MTALPTPTRYPRTAQLSLAFDNDELRTLDPNERNQVTRHLARLLIEAAGLGPCQTFFVPGSGCRAEGCDPTRRPRSMTTTLMSGAFPSGILTTFR